MPRNKENTPERAPHSTLRAATGGCRQSPARRFLFCHHVIWNAGPDADAVAPSCPVECGVPLRQQLACVSGVCF